MLKYVDISKYQGNIDFAKLAKEVDGVIIRAGYGRNTIDPYFEKYAKGCVANNIPFGVYWFSYALNREDARQEAKACLEAIKPYKVELPVCFDFEGDSVRYAKDNGVTITKSLASAIARTFCSYVENAGYYAANYANEDYCKNYFDADVLSKYALWYARYLNAPNLSKPPRECAMWQYTSTGKVNGISGNVDVNAVYVDFRAIIAKAGLNNLQNDSSTGENKKPWYSDAQAWAVEKGITDGSDPTAPATRAEVWAMLQRAFAKGE